MSKKIINNYFKLLAEGNIPALFELFDPNVKWHQPGENKFSGIKNGVDEIGQMIGGMMEDTAGSFKIVLASNVMINTNLISAPVEFSAQKGSKSMKMKGIDLFRVENNKITEVWLFSESQADEDQFWK